MSTVPVLGCTACEYVLSPRLEQWSDLADTGCPRCHGRTWLVSFGDPTTPAQVRPALATTAAPEENDHA
jgi:hypothetical protein